MGVWHPHTPHGDAPAHSNKVRAFPVGQITPRLLHIGSNFHQQVAVLANANIAPNVGVAHYLKLVFASYFIDCS